MHTPKEAQGLRTLQVVGGLNRAGVETWLVEALPYLSQEHITADFVVHHSGPWDYDRNARRAGSQVLVCQAGNPLNYVRQFRRLLKIHGPYDIVHTHIQNFGAVPLLAAAISGVPLRLFHSHLDMSPVTGVSTLPRQAYEATTRLLVMSAATGGFAVSEAARVHAFGKRDADPSWPILPPGVSFARFSNPRARAAVRRELGLSDEDFVLVNIGRLEQQKNHVKLLQIVEAAQSLWPRLACLIVGRGALRVRLEDQADQLGVSDRIRFLGVRDDVPDLLAASDVFVFPSIREGLGLAAIEAQAAGLPVVLSDGVPEEAIVVEGLVVRRRLTDPVTAWVEGIDAARHQARSVSREEALDRVAASAFSIESSVRALAEAYRGSAAALYTNRRDHLDRPTCK